LEFFSSAPAEVADAEVAAAATRRRLIGFAFKLDAARWDTFLFDACQPTIRRWLDWVT